MDITDTIPDRHLVDKEMKRLAEAEVLFGQAIDVFDCTGAGMDLAEKWGECRNEELEELLPNHDLSDIIEYYDGIYRRARKEV